MASSDLTESELAAAKDILTEERNLLSEGHARRFSTQKVIFFFFHLFFVISFMPKSLLNCDLSCTLTPGFSNRLLSFSDHSC